MKIALINENSQAAKNALIEATLRKVVEPMGHEVVNYGMYAADDAAQLTHVNDGNAVALPFAKGFGWGGELNLEYIFEKLFGFGHGQGYPKERVVPEQRNKRILDGVRAVAFRDLSDILKDLDRDLVKGAFAGEHFAEYFFPACKDEKLAATVRELMA